ncbi:MAG: 3'-5' exonuclease [Candidatus Omnitrophota bacterium]|nr:MAG: 3'-5' exonuclease [Candidatus Omnitrophota bacterium]
MDFERDIEEFDLVFLDLETTGLDVVEGDAICEVGAYKVRERRQVDKFHSLVNPKKAVPKEAYNIHKISDEELKNAPYFEQIADRLRAFLGDSVICAYNIKFDMGFLNYELKRLGSPQLEMPAVDILTMARKALRLPKYNLGAIALLFNVEYKDELHRALNDAYVAQEVFFKLRDILKQSRIDTLGDFVSLYGFENEVFKKQEEKKIGIIKEAGEKKEPLQIRYVLSGGQIQQVGVKSVNLSQENNAYYLWCHSCAGQSFRVKLSDVLSIEVK